MADIVLDALDPEGWSLADIDRFEALSGMDWEAGMAEKLRKHPKGVFAAFFVQNHKRLEVDWEWWRENISIGQLLKAAQIAMGGGDDDPLPETALPG